jgi:uncharacterized metal-binding protein YceD (DUF177 family)
MSEPEFSRTIRIDALGTAPRDLSIEASAEEREALARRFGLVAIDALSADISLLRTGGVIRGNGRLEAEVIQSCVASGVPVEARLAEAFAIAFAPPPEASGRGEEEIELSEGDCDTIFYSGPEIDVGEAVAETLSLSLDPWPRAPDADESLKAAGVKNEAEVGPFAALAGLKDSLKG